MDDNQLGLYIIAKWRTEQYPVRRADLARRQRGALCCAVS